jgi:hypothetical protein
MKKLLLISFILLISIRSYSQITYPRDQKIITGEYFINSDPGEGKGTIINTGVTQLVDVTVNLANIVLPVGSNLYVRFKSSNGFWSAPRSIKRKPYFENAGATLQYGECFINTDPGKGLGQQVNFTNGIANISDLNLRRGDKVYVRIRDNLNRWSPSRSVTFNFKEIDRAEYYIEHPSGGVTGTQTMNLSLYNPYSCVYTANAENIIPTNLDKIYVRFQTKDKMYSQYLSKLVVLPGIGEIPSNTFQFSNYPNPFADQTKICFELPGKSNVRIKIIGLLGNEVQILADEQMIAGKHEIQFDRSGHPAGIYYCRLETDRGSATIKLLIKD